MYYLEPEREEAYQVPNNYYFGSELMVSPITEKIDTKTQLGKAKTWLPSGVWYDFFNGRKYEGGRMVQLFRGIEEIPVLAREGAIVPLKNMEVFDNDTDNPKSLEMKIFPGKTGSFTLWEDEGDSVEESWVETKLEKATGRRERLLYHSQSTGKYQGTSRKTMLEIGFCKNEGKYSKRAGRWKRDGI